MPVIFLDIDGVLLSEAAWQLPANLALKAGAKKMTTYDFAMAATYDPVAVALLNRLCRVTRSTLVISSSWRYAVGEDATRQKLIEQGVHDLHFHADWHCPRHMHIDKLIDIAEWLEDHPECTEHLVLDDEDMSSHRAVRLDSQAGLTLADYPQAVVLLGGTDPRFEARPSRRERAALLAGYTAGQ